MENGQKKPYRKRTRSAVGADGTSRTERIAQRNRVLVARWYYWTECRRLRSDDAIKRLCDEFFVESRTVTGAILDGDEYFRELLDNKASNKDLSKEYNSFNWS
ncbi:MAG: hypothetical protein E7136_05325 [Rikenellaceae bacterium]|nr:hypothetical protein [Rikenellaceae bacterium]